MKDIRKNCYMTVESKAKKYKTAMGTDFNTWDRNKKQLKDETED